MSVYVDFDAQLQIVPRQVVLKHYHVFFRLSLHYLSLTPMPSYGHIFVMNPRHNAHLHAASFAQHGARVPLSACLRHSLSDIPRAALRTRYCEMQQ